MEAFFCPSGLTVRELRELLNNIPDTNPDGEAFEVWVETGIGLSSQVKSVWSLNNGPDGCDVFLSPS